MVKMYNHWVLQPAENVNAAIAALPIATEKKIYDELGNVEENWKRIEVDGVTVDIPSKHYVLKQHEQAFRPVIEGLTVSGVENFEFSLWNTRKRAHLAVFVGELEDGVKFGFKVTNSFDRSLAIHFGAKAYQQQKSVEIVERDHVLVWGIRQVCTNGMTMRIPLKTCKYLDTQEVVKIKDLLKMKGRILHVGNDVDKKLESMQYVVEAFTLLKNPLNMMIIDAQNFHLNPIEARELILKYVGKRRMDKYLELWGQEEKTLWGLYNSITFLASHSIEFKSTLREGLLTKAANLLEGELMPEMRVPTNA
jgi:hypothetical protein